MDPLVHIHKLAVAVGVLVVVSVLGACSAPAEAGGGPCDLVDAATVTDLAGREIGAPREAVVGTVPVCQWHDGDVTVQVSQVAAAEWVVALPAIVEQIRQGDVMDEAALARVEKAAKLVESGKVDPAAACDMFSLLLELSGEEPGADRTVTLIPNAQAPRAISGQSCVDGVHSSVLLAAPGLSADSPKISTVDVALNELTAAGV
ncbi:hypothetical protein [Promicromonospora sukumoe]